MGLFICDICDCVENTATGFYHARNMDKWVWKDGIHAGLALCSECTPTEYYDGSPNEDGGKWHGKWEKTIMTEELVLARLAIRENYFTYLGRFEYLRGRDDNKKIQELKEGREKESLQKKISAKEKRERKANKFLAEENRRKARI